MVKNLLWYLVTLQVASSYDNALISRPVLEQLDVIHVKATMDARIPKQILCAKSWSIKSCYNARSMITDQENTRSVLNVLPPFAVHKSNKYYQNKVQDLIIYSPISPTTRLCICNVPEFWLAFIVNSCTWVIPSTNWKVVTTFL